MVPPFLPFYNDTIINFIQVICVDTQMN